MTSWIKVKIGGKEAVVKAGGYTGKNEAKTPKGDVITANRVWVDKETARRLGLRVGKKVRIRVGRTVKTGVVKRWSRGSRQIIFLKPGLPRSVKVIKNWK